MLRPAVSGESSAPPQLSNYRRKIKSIPTIIPDLNFAVFDPDRKAVDIFISGRGFYCAGFYAKTRAVARTDNQAGRGNMPRPSECFQTGGRARFGKAFQWRVACRLLK